MKTNPVAQFLVMAADLAANSAAGYPRTKVSILLFLNGFENANVQHAIDFVANMHEHNLLGKVTYSELAVLLYFASVVAEEVEGIPFKPVSNIPDLWSLLRNTGFVTASQASTLTGLIESTFTLMPKK